MSPLIYDGSAPASNTLRKAVGVSPLVQNIDTERGSLAAFYWHTPWLTSYELERSDEVILSLHTGGSRTVRTRTKTGWSDLVSTPGRMAIIPAGQLYAFKPDGRLEFVTLHFRLEQIGELIGVDKAQAASLPFRFAFDDPFARACVRKLCEELRSMGEHGSLFIDSLSDALWLHLLRSSGDCDERVLNAPVGISRARDKIEASIASGVSLADLAEEAGMSRFYFVRAFHDAVGEPPHRYLTRCRIERAKELLRRKDMALVDIALSVGYSSQSHFSAAFRSLVGRTPRQFRVAPDD